MKRNILPFICLPTSILFLLGSNLATGPVQIPFADVLDILCGHFIGKESWEYIVLEDRLPQTLTAIFCGASLSVCGLMSQTAFRNSSAGPDVLGISSDAGLGVALVILLLGGIISASTFTASGLLVILTAVFAGAIAVTALILFLFTSVCNSVLSLVAGIMVGYVSSSAVPFLNLFASEEGVKSYMVWRMGNLGVVPMNHILLFPIPCLIGIIVPFLLVKSLNIPPLGPQYVESLGTSTRQICNILLVVAGLLTAITTAFCGPIPFIGLAIPHIARLLFRIENHQILPLGTVLSGAVIALLCNFICYLPGESGITPLNIVTPFTDAPVIIYAIIQCR